MLISLSEALETPVSALLGENVSERKTDELKAICEKLEVINLQLAQRKTTKIAAFHCLFIALCATTVLVSAVLIALNSPYLGWNFSDPETAVSVRLIMCSSGCLSESHLRPLSRRSSELL